MKHDSAGDPMGGLRWTHRTTEKISRELRSLKIEVSPRTVSRLLRQMGFSLRVNHRKICRGTPAERDALGNVNYRVACTSAIVAAQSPSTARPRHVNAGVCSTQFETTCDWGPIQTLPVAQDRRPERARG